MSRFRTIEISDPRFESDNLRYITVKTPNLNGRGDICIFEPAVPDATGLPMVILLHGVYGSAWVWSQKGGAHRTATRLIGEGKIQPMVLVMPSDGLWGDGSAYLRHSQFDFESWIVSDVPEVVTEVIPSVAKHSKRFIGGLSMGGFGALRLGAMYHRQFDGISAHSSITSLEQLSLFVEEPLASYKQNPKMLEDAWQTIFENRDSLPPIRFDCGVNDPLIAYNRDLHQKMEDNRIPHQYFEFSGEHEWGYWIKHLEDTLIFFDQLLSKTV